MADRANDGNGGGRKAGVTLAEVARRKQVVYELMIAGYRPQNIFRMWPGDTDANDMGQPSTLSHRKRTNVWLGTSCENQATADERIPELLKVAHLAQFTFLSMEPLLGRVDLWGARYEKPSIDWVILGGESGTGARSCDVDHIAKAVEECEAAQVAVFVKQLGAAPICDGERMKLSDTKGGEMNEWPAELRVRQFPRP